MIKRKSRYDVIDFLSNKEWKDDKYFYEENNMILKLQILHLGS